jgi:hypothetical protein
MVIHWALNTLSALKLLHNCGIFYGSITTHEHSCLTSELSFQLAAFVDAEFVDPVRGEYHEGNIDEKRSVQSDLFGWASLLYALLVKRADDENPEFRENVHPFGSDNVLPHHFNDPEFLETAGEAVKKCFLKQFESADEAWDEFTNFLRQKGYEVEDHGLSKKSFDPVAIFHLVEKVHGSIVEKEAEATPNKWHCVVS